MSATESTVLTRGYLPSPGASLALTLTLGYGLAGVAPPSPPVTPTPIVRGAPVWWRRREEEPEEETDDKIRIVPFEDEPVVTEEAAIELAVPLEEYLPPKPDYSEVAARVRADSVRELGPLVDEGAIARRVQAFIDEQERRRKRRMREDEEMLLLS